MIEVPNTPARRTDRCVCPACEASPGTCRSSEWLRGRRCCEACTGDHDREVSPWGIPPRPTRARTAGEVSAKSS